MSSHAPRGAYREMLRRDLLLAWRRRAELMNPPVFFLLVIALFPLGLGPDARLLARIAPGVLWVVALLATLLSTDRLFRSDHEDGSLDQLVLSPHSLYGLVFVRMAAHWLVTGLPLSIVAPLLAGMLYLPAGAMPTLVLALLAGTFALSFVGGIGAGLTVGLDKGGILLSLLILPLYIPVLIFGTAAVDAATAGMPAAPALAILLALAILAATLAPLAVAAALRLGSDR